MSKHVPFCVVLAAGGIGSRMSSSIPKQFLKIDQKPLVLYSFELFLSLPEVSEIVVVCDPSYQSIFNFYTPAAAPKISFANPGQRRQDSVLRGIENLSGDPLVCIHDAARPFINVDLVRRTTVAAEQWGAAVVGVPVKATIKICNEERWVVATPERSKLWEIQTPQVVRLSLLKEGYAYAQSHNDLTVTDDVSLVELLGKPVKLIEGSYSNIKVTTPEDLTWAEQLHRRHVQL